MVVEETCSTLERALDVVVVGWAGPVEVFPDTVGAEGRVAEEEVVEVDASDVVSPMVLSVVLLEGTGRAPPKFPGLVAMTELILCVSVLTTICTVGAPVGLFDTKFVHSLNQGN
jgi:hypothetical protein